MPVPQLPEKLTQSSLLRAEDVIAHNSHAKALSGLAKAAILTYQSSIIKVTAKRYRLKKIKGLYGDVHWLGKPKNGVIVASNFGIGAPVAAVMMENLIALGVKKFISIGTAGSINDSLKIGELVVCSKALRDEGTSHHYLPASEYALPSKSLTIDYSKSLDTNGYAHRKGPSWTTDAPYRETGREIDHYRAEGIFTVEMEAATLFAVGQFRKVDVSAAFSISDIADENGWQFDTDTRSHYQGLIHLFDAAVATLR